MSSRSDVHLAICLKHLGLIIILLLSQGVFSQPPCNPDSPVPTPTCPEFDPPLCLLEEVDGYCGRNPSDGGNGSSFCTRTDGGATTLDNPGFIRFVSSGGFVHLRVYFDNCVGTPSIQLAAYPGCNLRPSEAVSCDANCDENESPVEITFDAVAGQTYTILIDGCSGSQCDFTIEVIEGAGIPDVDEFTSPDDLNGPGITPGDTLCEGATNLSCLTYSVIPPPLAVRYIWQLNGEYLETTESPTVTLPELISGITELCVQGANDCDTNLIICQNIIVAPLPINEIDECFCYDDFLSRGYTYNGQLFTEEGEYFIDEIDPACGCPFVTRLTLETNGPPEFREVFDAVCLSDYESGYLFPGQSFNDLPFFEDESFRLITLVDNINYICDNTDRSILCDEEIAVTVRAMHAEIFDTTVYIPCGETEILLDTSDIVFRPEDLSTILFDFAWRDSSGTVISTAAEVIVDAPGIYQLELFMQDTLDQVEPQTECGPYIFNYEVLPQIPPALILDSLVCDDAEEFYTAYFSTTTAASDIVRWNANPTGTANGQQYVMSGIPSGDSYRLSLDDTQGCTSDILTGIKVCDCATGPGEMPVVLIEKCDGESHQFTPLDGGVLDPNDTTEYILHDQPGIIIGNIIARNNTGLFSGNYPQNIGDTLYVNLVVGNAETDGSVDLSDPCLAVSNGQPVVWHEQPIAEAGTDQDGICDFAFVLSATPSVGDGQWFPISGPEIPLLSAPMMASSAVDVSRPGRYLLEWVENNNGCEDRDTIELVFVDAPMWDGGPTFECDLNSNPPVYRVLLNISAGDTSSYVVTDLNGDSTGIINDVLFTSDTISLSQDWGFIVSDRYGCSQDTIRGVPDCTCTSAAGTVSQIGRDSLCQDEVYLMTTVPGTDTLDANDVREYLILDLDRNIVARSSDSTFRFIAGVMNYGQPYIISKVVGNDTGNGEVDLNDFCLDSIGLSQESTITWIQDPEVMISTNDPYCIGDNLEIIFSANTDALFSARISDGRQILDYNNLSNGVTRILPVLDTFSLTLVDVTLEREPFCSVNINQRLDIEINDTPELSLDDDITVCNINLVGESIINLENQVLLSEGGDWIDFDNSGATGSFDQLDFEGVPGGTYRFVYSTNTADAPCQDVSDTLYVQVDPDCPCPVIDIVALDDLCNDQNAITLIAQIPNPGTWSLASTPGGSNPAEIQGDQFIITGRDPGVYTVQYQLTDFTPLCPDSARFDVELFAPSTAGTALDIPHLCVGTVRTIQLFDYLQGADLGGQWRITGAPSQEGVVFDPILGTFETGGLRAGTYTIQYISPVNGPCPSDDNSVSITINPLPIVNAGPDAELSCLNEEITLGLDRPQGQNLTYQWLRDGVIITEGSQPMIVVDSVGVYTLLITNERTGCSATDDVVITRNPDDLSGVSVEVTDESCVGAQDGIIQVQSVSGGVPSYRYTLIGQGSTPSFIFRDLAPDDYTLRIEDGRGCTYDTIITVPAATPFDVLDIPNDTIILGDSVFVQLVLDSISLEEIPVIEWIGLNVISNDSTGTAWLRPTETSIYGVRIETENGCSRLVEFKIIVLKNNLVFTPNALIAGGNNTVDRSNIFFIDGPDILEIEYLRIFDRWGNMVYSLDNVLPGPDNHSWNGNRGNRPDATLDNGVYVWVGSVRFKDGSSQVVQGDITLLR